MNFTEKIKLLLQDLSTKRVTRHGEAEERVIVKCDPDSPLYPIIRELHDGRLPHDFVFATVKGALQCLAGYELQSGSSNRAHDAVFEVSDGLVDVYRSDLIAWAKDFSEHIDDAQAEGLIGPDADFETRMRVGQFKHIESIVMRLAEAIDDMDLEDNAEVES